MLRAVTVKEAQVNRLKIEIETADAIFIGAGAGLSTSAGFTYTGSRFRQYFADFEDKYGFHDMYSGGFYPYKTPEEYWAYWSRYIEVNRYQNTDKPVYENLFELVKDKNYFVITTNVDHCFQKAGFDKKRLFYMNLRSDDKFVENEGWHKAALRYDDFMHRHKRLHILLLELGVGYNTPAIIKYPFWQLTAGNPKSVYTCINNGEAFCPTEIETQSICINSDIGNILEQL